MPPPDDADVDVVQAAAEMEDDDVGKLDAGGGASLGSDRSKIGSIDFVCRHVRRS